MRSLSLSEGQRSSTHSGRPKVWRLFRLLDVPGLPRVPGLLALLVLRWPRLVPMWLRWRVAAKGLGLVVATHAEGVGSDGQARGDIGQALEQIGFSQGESLARQLGYGRSPLECARAVALANRLYAIDATVVAGSEHEARVITPGCPWSRERWWGPRPCGAFSRYERGLTRGLNPDVSLRYESKRTRGDSRCIGVYRLRTRGQDLAPALSAPLLVASHEDIDEAGEDGDDERAQDRPAEAGDGHARAHDPVEYLED